MCVCVCTPSLFETKRWLIKLLTSSQWLLKWFLGADSILFQMINLKWNYLRILGTYNFQVWIDQSNYVGYVCVCVLNFDKWLVH